MQVALLMDGYYNIIYCTARSGALELCNNLQQERIFAFLGYDYMLATCCNYFSLVYLRLNHWQGS